MKVFVYGSLKRGFVNHQILKNLGATFIGKDRAPGVLYNLGPFPGALRHPEAVIRGEVYEVNAKTLQLLDRFEGHPRMYRREEIELLSGETAFIYYYQGTVLGLSQVGDEWTQRDVR